MKIFLIVILFCCLGFLCLKALGAETTTYSVVRPDGTRQVCTVYPSGAVLCR